MRDNRGRRDDALARKVMQLEKGVERAKGSEPQARARSATEESVEELRQTMARLVRQNEELSKEVGRFRLLEEQRAKPIAPSSATPQPAIAKSSSPPRSPRKCFNCDLPGHIAKECPQEKRPRRSGADRVGGTSTASGSCSKRNQTCLTLVINGKSRRCLLDTGSYVTLLPVGVVSGVQRQSTARKIIAANGTPIKVLGSAVVTACASNIG